MMMNKESLEKIVSLSDIQVSPDGAKLITVMTRMNLEENRYETNLMAWDTQTRVSSVLTSQKTDKAPVWLDRETVLFQSGRNEESQKRKADKLPSTGFYKLNVNGGEAIHAFNLPLDVQEFNLINSDEALFYAMIPIGAPVDKIGSEEWDKHFKQDGQYNMTVFDELPFWSNGKGVVNKKRRRLFKVKLSDQTVQCLSPAEMNVDKAIHVSPQNRLYFIGSSYDDVFLKESTVYSVDLSSGETSELKLSDAISLADIFWINHELIFYGNLLENSNSYQNPQFYHEDNGILKPWNPLDIQIGSSTSTDCVYGFNKVSQICEDGLDYLRAERIETGLYHLNQAGETLVHSVKRAAIQGFVRFENRYYYLATKNQGLQELYCYDSVSGEDIQLSHVNEDYFEEVQLLPVRVSQFINQAGVDLDLFVIEPADYDKTQKYPAILNIRGGPKGISGDSYFHEMQLLAHQGYFVYITNPRGSAGRGSEFANIEGERYGNWDYQDFMDCTDHVLALYPAIDEKRLGVMGGSYGGFMTNWIVSQTDRFKAGITDRSIANYVTKCLTTDIGYYHNIHQMGKVSVWEDVMTYWNHSPLKYADQVKTALLFIHSDEDYRCYMGDALQYFTALKLHGVKTRFCLFHGENHELSRGGKPANRMKRLEENLSWMRENL